jgi:hypothetical protein
MTVASYEAAAVGREAPASPAADCKCFATRGRIRSLPVGRGTREPALDSWGCRNLWTGVGSRHLGSTDPEVARAGLSPPTAAPEVGSQDRQQEDGEGADADVADHLRRD